MGKGRRLRLLRTSKNADIVYTRDLSSSWFYIIRYIALITMTSDHLGTVLFDVDVIDLGTYLLMRMVGRIAFPLFAFELVETFFHTKNRKKHLLMLGVVALLSEPFFDLALVSNSPVKLSAQALSGQNVILTLFLGFLLMTVLEVDWKTLFTNSPPFKNKYVGAYCAFVFRICLIAGAMFLSNFLLFDYDWVGILLIFLFYFARKRKHKRIWQFIAMLCFYLTMPEPFAYYATVLFALIPIYLGEMKHIESEVGVISKVLTSKPSKMICRYFYPAHLLILTVVKIILLQRGGA